MNKKNAIETTLKHIDTFKELSQRAYDQASCVYILNPTSYCIEELPECYQYGIIEDGCRLAFLMEMEVKLLGFSEDDVIKLLAHYSATQKLLVDVDKFYRLKMDVELPPSKHQHQFSRTQSVLMAHYIFEMAGIDRNQTDITVCSEILLCMLKIPYDKIANTEIYEKMRKLFTISSPKKMLEDLRLVRTYLVKLNNHKVLESIDLQIEKLNKLNK